MAEAPDGATLPDLRLPGTAFQHYSISGISPKQVWCVACVCHVCGLGGGGGGGGCRADLRLPGTTLKQVGGICDAACACTCAWARVLLHHTHAPLQHNTHPLHARTHPDHTHASHTTQYTPTNAIQIVELRDVYLAAHDFKDLLSDLVVGLAHQAQVVARPAAGGRGR